MGNNLRRRGFQHVEDGPTSKMVTLSPPNIPSGLDSRRKAESSHH